MGWRTWEEYFPADAANLATGVREGITEFFVILAGSQVFGSTKDVDVAKDTARSLRDGMGVSGVRIKRVKV